MDAEPLGGAVNLSQIVGDPGREDGIPVCAVIPIRWRQVMRAALARFFRSRVHVAIVLIDIFLLLLESRDTLGVLSLPPIRAGLILLLMYESIFFTCDLFYHTLFYKTYFFDIREQSLIVRHGVLCKRELTLPLARITDVYLDQDFWGRVLGVCDLHVSSPTSASGRFAHIPGIDREGAQAFRVTLLSFINRK